MRKVLILMVAITGFAFGQVKHNHGSHKEIAQMQPGDLLPDGCFVTLGDINYSRKLLGLPHLVLKPEKENGVSANNQNYYVHMDIYNVNINNSDDTKRVLESKSNLYFDIGMGLGLGYNNNFGVYTGVKFGLALGDIPLYIIVDGETSNYIDFLLAGGGLVFYPTTFLQVSLSAGYSWKYDSTDGFGISASIAYDFGKKHNGLIIGVQYMGALHLLNSEQYSFPISFIGGYAKYRWK